MSKDWQYASLGSNERLDLIKKGDEDIYSSEKKRNSALRQLKSSLGLSTDDVDTWDSMVDEARNKYVSDNLFTRKDVSAIAGSPATKATYSLNNEMKAISDSLSVSKEKAFDKAHNELETISEWLAANGYSVTSNTTKKAKKEVERELATELRLLEAEYKQKAAKAVAAAISMLK